MLAIYAPYRTSTPAEIRLHEQQYTQIKKSYTPKPLSKAEPTNTSGQLTTEESADTSVSVFISEITQYYRNVVIEYKLVRKILLIAIPLFIIITILSFVDPRIRMSFGILVDIPLFQNGENEYEAFYALLSGLWAGLFFTVSGGLLRMLFWLGRKNFRYNFAKGCAIFSREDQDIHAKLEYLLLSLDSYNRFLQRTIRLKFNELVLSKIVKLTLNDYGKINTISSYFESEDTLFPAKQLLNSQDLNPINDEFLVKGKTERMDIIKEWGALSAALIPLAITVVKEVFFPSSPL